MRAKNSMDFFQRALLFLFIATNGFMVFAEAVEHYESRYISLKSGEVSVVYVPGVKRVAIGNPDVVNYKTLENDQVMLIAAGAGKTNVHVWGEGDRQIRYWVSVDQRHLNRDIETAKMLTRDIKGLSIYQLDEKIIIEGAVMKRDSPILQVVSQMLPNAVLAIKEKAFEPRQTIRIDAIILEIAENDLKKIGVDWGDSMSGPAWAFHKTILSDDMFKFSEKDSDNVNSDIIKTVPFNGRGFYSYLGITSSLLSRINLLSNAGEARVLSSPKLTTSDGQKARFNVGGDFPIPYVTENGQVQVQYKEYGVTLDALPTLQGEIINMELEVELSDIDPSVTVLGVPGTKKRSTQTTVQLQDGQTLAISGLFQDETSSADNKVPFLGDLPVLKKIFSSHDSDKKQKQVVVLITPHVIVAGDARDSAMSEMFKPYMRENKKGITVDDSFLE